MKRFLSIFSSVAILSLMLYASVSAALPTSGNAPGGNTGSGGQSIKFELENPLKTDDLVVFIKSVITWLVAFAIPIAVGMIIWSGLRMIWARGNLVEFAAARKILWYTILGLLILFIGGGFVTLVASILEAGN